MSEIFRINLYLEDWIVRKNPAFVDHSGKNCHRRKLFPDGGSCVGAGLFDPSPAYDTVRVSFSGGTGGLVQWRRSESAQERGQVAVGAWARVCMCVFACMGRDVGCVGAFAFEACIARVVIF